MKKRHWLITAFEPFGGRSENNSRLVLDEIQKLIHEAKADPSWPYFFHFHILPVEYDRSFQILQEKITSIEANGFELEGWLGLGEAETEFKIEQRAHNLDDVPNFPDNAGVVRTGKTILNELGKGHPLALRFPFEAFGRIRSSNHAGCFVCNHVSLKMAHTYPDPKKLPYLGFIHVPRVGQGGAFTPDVCASIIVNGFRKFLA